MATREQLAQQQAQRRALAGRLNQLIERAGTSADFCRLVWPQEKHAVEGNKAKVWKWSRGDSGISPDEAAQIAKAFKVRAGWLLFGELPEHEGVSRTEANLADDVAAYIKAALDMAVTPSALGEQGEWTVYGDHVLQVAVDQALRQARRLVSLDLDPEVTVGLGRVDLPGTGAGALPAKNTPTKRTPTTKRGK